LEIQAEHVAYVFNPGTPLEQFALRDVNFTLPHGSVLGLLGGTGSGKTTLIRTLNGLLNPTEGRILINGKDTRTFGPDLRQKIGVVFQRPERQLFEETVFDDISFVLRRFSGFSESRVRSIVLEACKTAGLNIEAVGERPPVALSDGERRKAAIAGILVNEPDVLILDEPAVGLDPPSIVDLVSVIESMKTEDDRTVIIASHDMDPFLEILDYMTLLYQGRTMSFGTPDEVCSDLADNEMFRSWLPDLAVLVHDLRGKGYAMKPNEFRIPELVKQLTSFAGSSGGCL
jgi:energy-coupling factor transport system ATP-binding protein